jgi:ketosteroid isomerase-like protein
MSMTDEISAAKAVIALHEEFSRAGDLAGVLTNIANDIVLVVPNTGLASRTSRKCMRTCLAWGDGTLGMSVREQTSWATL